MDRSVSPLIVSKTSADWSAQDPFLARGDYGVESDTGREKVGVGSRWSQTPYKPDDSGENPVSYAQVETYAAMLALGTPSVMTVCRVTSDENKNASNTIYQVWPNGVRLWMAALAD